MRRWRSFAALRMTELRVVVTGASGLVGRAVVAKFQAIALTRRDLDITDRAAVRRKMTDLRPDLVINCAVVGVDACEDDPKLARAVNVDGPKNLAEVAPAMVHFSSNYVFDGREEKFYAIDDAPNPINEYGRTKREGERAVAAANRNAFIVRSSWIFGPGKESFISTVHRELRDGKTVRAVSDIWASTTYVDDLVLRLVEIIEKREYGLHHVVNAGVCSNATFALEAAPLVGARGASRSTAAIHAAPRIATAS
ncbi:MAG: dTDP-4-dehydrorhamnose reductase [Acidobacteria bacterium]|nr:MAG: dTDP-4-dehydrorhamnose reductase [Acidobacteriota bacterium]